MPDQTATQELTVVEQVQKLPAPNELFGANIRTAVTEVVGLLRAVPQVESEDDASKLESAIQRGNKAVKYAGEQRLGITRIFDTFKSGYMQAEKDFLAELSPELQGAINRVSDFRRKQLAAKRAAEAKVIAEREAEAKRKRAASSIAAVETAKQEDLAEVAKTHQIAGTSTVWKSEVTNASLVPLEYCSPDPAKIAAAVKQGVRSIPGVNIFEDIKRTGRS